MSRNPSLRLVRACFAASLLLAGLMIVPLPAAAQCTEEPCGPIGDNEAPAITFANNASSYPAGNLPVTIYFTDNYLLDHGSRQITYTTQSGTQNVTSSFTYLQTNNWTTRATGTIAIQPGNNVLTATICDGSPNHTCNTQSSTYVGQAPSVRVAAENLTLAVPSMSRGVSRYRVVNTGLSTTTFALSASCSLHYGCTPATSSVQLAAGDSAWVDVNFTTPAIGGSVTLTASAGSVNHSAATGINTQVQPDPGYVGDARSLLRIQRDACITIATGPGTASECGDLRVAHALPSVRVLNKVSTPVLIYNSGHARPFPVVAAQFAGPAGVAVDSISAVLTVNGVARPAERWVGWGPQQTRRISVAFDATTSPTGLYSYTLTVIAKRSDGTRDTLPVSRSGRMIIVNRANSPFGAGWWLAGVERLELNDIPGDTLKLWVGGDGSARLYRGPAGGPWRADNYDRPDSIYRPAGTTGYARALPGGARVHFDGSGIHVVTENALGQVTVFNWAELPTEKRLESIVLPQGANHPEQQSYQLEYGTVGPGCTTATTGLTRVRAPAAAGGYSDTWLCGDNQRRVRRIRDASPDTTSVAFGYVSGTGWMANRTDRMGVTQDFGYRRVRFYNAVQPVRPGINAVTYVIAVETHGVNSTASISADSTRVVFDGPRTDLCDCAWWHVDRYGAPVDMRNAIQQVTTIRRGDARWPGLATETVAPNGFTTTANYDALGFLTSTTTWNPYGDGRNPTTTLRWNPQWSAPEEVVSPEGEITLMGYDGYGRRDWQQVGPSATRKVQYVYNPMTHLTAPGQLERIVYPNQTADRLEYNERGNLSATVSPLGARSEFYSDRLGRVTVKRVAIDTVGGVIRFQGDTTSYDEGGRVRRVASFAPALRGEGVRQAVVVNDYDREGRLTAVSRTSVLANSPTDPLGIGTITTRWEYDLAGRRTVEIAPDNTPANPLDNPRDSTIYDLAGNVERVRTRRFAEMLAANPVTAADPYAPYIRTTYDHLNRPKQRITPQIRYDSIGDGLAQRGFIYPHENFRIDGAYSNRQRALPYPWYPNAPNWGYRISGDTATFAYDDMGNLLRADNRDAWIRRSYYPGGALRGDTLKIRTVAELPEGGDSTSHVYGLEHTYDRNGRRTELKHPDNIAPRTAGTLQDRTRFTFDAVTGALETVTDPLNNTFRYHYGLLGQVDSLSMPGQLRDVYEYDADGRLTRHLTRNGSTAGPDRYATSLLRDERYLYDTRGKMLFSGNAAGAADTSFVTYTGLGHVYRDSVRSRGMPYNVNGASFVPLSNAVQDVRHDALGNLSAVRNVSTFELPWRKDTSVDMAFSRYQLGTGRLLATDDGWGLDIQRYDSAGNVVFSKTDSLKGNPSAAVGLRDKALFYGADGMLHAAETRVVDDRTNQNSSYRRAFEEYRYDALGRRVWVRARRECQQGYEGYCELGWVRRTIWDGDRELYEIQAPSSENGYFDARREYDTQPVGLVAWGGLPGDGTDVDPNPFYGRVAYTYGGAIDQPLSVVRMGYGDIRDITMTYGGSTHRVAEPFAIVPLWNTRGQAGLGAFADGTWRKCETAVWSSGSQPKTRCIKLNWPELWAGYARPQMFRDYWHGTLLQDKQDGSGLNYRRNRYYDPSTGRFTQEDPIGLAGGLNVYGFGEGDPVNHSDPFGLKVCFRGTTDQIDELKTATEAASGTTFDIGADKCVVESSIESNGKRALARNRAIFRDMAASTERDFIVRYAVPQDQLLYSSYGPSRNEANTWYAVVVPSDLGDSYNTPVFGVTGCLLFWTGRTGYDLPAIIAHELLGHGEASVRRGAYKGSPDGVPAENRYHRANRQPTRCGRQ